MTTLPVLSATTVAPNWLPGAGSGSRNSANPAGAIRSSSPSPEGRAERIVRTGERDRSRRAPRKVRLVFSSQIWSDMGTLLRRGSEGQDLPTPDAGQDS